ncbi:MAG: galactose-1-epimerase [Gammaproteobacteria bacterium]|nr:MAG: galactose-1-epimerase [Gammaproteobacteria bacterium]
MAIFEPITLSRPNGLSIALSRFGATWLSCQIPLQQPREILLGCQIGDLSMQAAYLGATVGRYANRIKDAHFSLNGKSYHITTDQDSGHALHGGIDNFSYRLWEVSERSDDHVTFFLHSSDGDQGFNGDFNASVTYTLTDDAVIIDYHADCDQVSVCSLTNHAYFNLGQAADARRQWLTIPSERYSPIDTTGIPLGDLISVADNPFDFREKRQIIQAFDALLADDPTSVGFDHDWYFGDDGKEKVVCELQADDESLAMTLRTTQPALHVYSGNGLSGTPNRSGGTYDNFAGIALETGCLANSPNRQKFVSECMVSQNKPYQHRSVYQFDW